MLLLEAGVEHVLHSLPLLSCRSKGLPPNSRTMPNLRPTYAQRPGITSASRLLQRRGDFPRQAMSTGSTGPSPYSQAELPKLSELMRNWAVMVGGNTRQISFWIYLMIFNVYIYNIICIYIYNIICMYIHIIIVFYIILYCIVLSCIVLYYI